MRENVTQQRKQRRIFRERAIRKKWEKSRNLKRNSERKPKYRRPRYPRLAFHNIRRIKVPSDFTLNSNKNGVLAVVHQCKNIDLANIKQVLFDFSDVKEVATGAMTILLANVMYLADNKIVVGGNKPLDKRAKRKMERSNFFQRLGVGVDAENRSNPNAILEKGFDETEQKRTAELIRLAMKTVWGLEDRNTKIQGMLIELMANSINHAFEKSHLKKQWYLSVDHENRKDSVEFCFLDNGEGILKTVNLKFKDRIEQLVGNSSDILIKEAFEGTFGSRTRIPHRGRGLPAIRNVCELGVIRGLKVITNDVYLDFETGETETLERGFDGTFYYWVLDKSCK